MNVNDVRDKHNAGKRGIARLIDHPLALASFRHWVRLSRAGGGIDPRYRWRAAQVTALSPFGAALRAAERLSWNRQAPAVAIAHPPVFILGHWRTGTTHLHNLMTRDPQFGFVSTFQVLVPESCLLPFNPLRPLIAWCAPARRHMDRMPLGLDLPQEEEFALCNRCGHSFYVGWYFPRRMDELFRKYVLFEGLSEPERIGWSETYLDVLKKATIRTNGRPLVLKNPVNTARIPTLLQLFPQAKFIHVYRDPYTVFKSTLNFHRATLDMVAFQKIPDSEIERNVLTFYRDMTCASSRTGRAYRRATLSRSASRISNGIRSSTWLRSIKNSVCRGGMKRGRMSNDTCRPRPSTGKTTSRLPPPTWRKWISTGGLRSMPGGTRDGRRPGSQTERGGGHSARARQGRRKRRAVTIHEAFA